MISYFVGPQPQLVNLREHPVKKIDSTRTEVDLPGMRWLNRAAVHEFPLPQKKTGRWESLCSSIDKRSVLVAALTPDNKLVLVRQYRFPVESFAVELPGGVVDPGENPEAAVARELLQETGYAATTVQRMNDGWSWNAKSNAQFSIYLATGCYKAGAVNLDPVEAYTELTVFTEEGWSVASKIVMNDPEYRDPTLSHGILPLIVRGLIRV